MDDSVPMPVEDSIIISKMEAGDEEGLRMMLRKYAPKLKGWLTMTYGGMLSNEDIDDVLNKAAFKIWKAVSQYNEGRGSFSAWIFRIHQYTALDTARRNGHVKEGRLFVDPTWPDVPEDDQAIQNQPNQLLMDFLDALENLPERQREILAADLHAGESADSHWIAEQLGISVNAVQVARSRGRKAIWQELLQRGHESTRGTGS